MLIIPGSHAITFKAKLSHRTNKDGTATVFIGLLQDRIKREVNTGIRVHPKAWNPNPRDTGTGLKEYIKKTHLSAAEYNKRIFALIKKGEAAISEAEVKGESLHIDQVNHQIQQYLASNSSQPQQIRVNNTAGMELQEGAIMHFAAISVALGGALIGGLLAIQSPGTGVAVAGLASVTSFILNITAWSHIKRAGKIMDGERLSFNGN